MSVTAGSTRSARRAGTAVATIAATPINALTPNIRDRVERAQPEQVASQHEPGRHRQQQPDGETTTDRPAIDAQERAEDVAAARTEGEADADLPVDLPDEGVLGRRPAHPHIDHLG